VYIFITAELEISLSGCMQTFGFIITKGYGKREDNGGEVNLNPQQGDGNP